MQEGASLWWSAEGAVDLIPAALKLLSTPFPLQPYRKHIQIKSICLRSHEWRKEKRQPHGKIYSSKRYQTSLYLENIPPLLSISEVNLHNKSTNPWKARKKEFTLRNTHLTFYERWTLFLSQHTSVDFHSHNFSPKSYCCRNYTRQRIISAPSRRSRALHQNADRNTCICCNATHSNSSVSRINQPQTFM